MLILPNLIVIGAMKGGTTSLHHYLDRHPQIAMSRVKELKFFLSNGHRARWHLGLDWYGSQFAADAPVRGESSPAYTKHPRFPGVAERMHRIVPHARLVYIVRDPVERTISHYRHLYSSYIVDDPLDVLLDRDGARPVLAASRYAMQLELYLAHYELDRIMLVESESLRRDPAAEVVRLYRWLGVDGDVPADAFRRRFNRTFGTRRPNALGRAIQRRVGVNRMKEIKKKPGAKRLLFETSAPPPVDEATRARLAERLAPDAERLRRLTGRRFAGWSV